jgi:hypothetical protein
MPPDDILDKLDDLIVQATKERSHYYVKATAYDAHEEIKTLRRLLAAVDDALAEARSR